MRNTILFAVSILTVTFLASDAAAQRRGRESVTRAPLVVVTDPIVTASISVTCTLSHLGPATVEVTTNQGQALGGLVRVSTSEVQYQTVASSDCGELDDRYVSAMQNAVQTAFGTIGRTVSWDSEGAALQIQVALSPTATISHVADRTDGGSETICRDACGTPTCKRYAINLAVGEVVQVAGPLYTGAPQSWDGAFPNAYMSTEFIDCTNTAAATRHAELATPAQWVQMFDRIGSEVPAYLNAVLGRTEATFSARVSNVRRSDLAQSAFDSFESGNFAQAMTGFLEAFEVDGPSLNSGNQADLLYNAALSALFAGDFVIAEEYAARAMQIDSGGRVADLLAETRLRARDLQVFTDLGLPDPF